MRGFGAYFLDVLLAHAQRNWFFTLDTIPRASLNLHIIEEQVSKRLLNSTMLAY